MPAIERLANVAGMGKAVLEGIQYQRLLPKLAVLILLATLTGMLASMLTAGLLYMAYHLLVRYGLEADAAYIVIGVILTALTAISALLTRSYVKKIRRAMQLPLPVVSEVKAVANAFIDGLMTPPRHSK